MNATSGRRPSKVSDEELVDAAADASNTRQLLLLLGIAPYGGNYESIRQRLRTLGVDAPRFGTRPPPRAVDAVRLADAVRIARSYAEVARLLLLGESGAAQRRAKQLVTESGLDYSHFLGRASNRGERRGGRRGAPLSELLVQGRLYPTAALKRRLLREGLLLPRCACCGLLEWQGRVVPLELDHVNGDRADNRLENLRLVCPNCHAQTDTYRGRNIGRGGADRARDRRGAPEVAAAQARAADAHRRLERVFSCPA